ncbi:DUF2807 domain-containing protein [Mucilaginibacter pallidiroseus]|uniref:DUF2807 domain-containing protein n=1 Tax=Mucilaginibacter pallidiroseus TaxID=2599295 RepID=A0A563UCK1_9SPHI|nr:head GIN domain-containing protein [Mucilaginibacter pallidiroseus]TWR29056.1 DUF2807 domain-containing protein [Mucilaginibacter pallidiroseus]
MKNLALKLTILSAAIFAVTLTSCKSRCKKGSGNMVDNNRKVEEFDRLEVDGGYKVTLVQDSTNTVTVHADDNLMQYIQTGVSGSRLRIHNSKNLCSKSGIEVIVHFRKLQDLKGAGAVEFTNNGVLNFGDLKIDLSGASKVDLELKATNVFTKGSGATEIMLKGQAASHDVDLTGSGKLEALDFVVGKYQIETTGASNCRINVLSSLAVNTTGASEIEYRGTPSDVSTKKTGASTIKKID